MGDLSANPAIHAPAHRGGRVLLGVFIALAIAGTALLYRFDPNAADSPFLPCIFYSLSGWWCAGCGITRALHALVHGDITGALAMNPLAVLLLPMGALALLWNAGWRPQWAQPIIRLMTRPMLWVILIPVYWLARNLPWAPFSWLAPG